MRNALSFPVRQVLCWQIIRWAWELTNLLLLQIPEATTRAPEFPGGASGAIVHNVYWLTAAETGYLGLISLVILLLRPMIVGLRCGWRNRGDERGDLLLGLGISLLTVYIHSFYEWIFITFQVEYIFAATIGLIAGLAQQLGYWSTAAQTVQRTNRDFGSPIVNVAASHDQRSDRLNKQ